MRKPRFVDVKCKNERRILNLAHVTDLAVLENELVIWMSNVNDKGKPRQFRVDDPAEIDKLMRLVSKN